MADCCLCRVVLELCDPEGVEFIVEDPDDRVVLETGDAVVPGGTYPDYTGEYVFTPGPEEQVVRTKNTVLLDNITIRPIPRNYGLITYNGSFITVS
jgi:hypothetical protein